MNNKPQARDRTQDSTIINASLVRMLGFLKENKEEVRDEIYKGTAPDNTPVTAYFFTSDNLPPWNLVRRVGDLESELKKDISFTGRLYLYKKDRLPMRYIEKKIWPVEI